MALIYKANIQTFVDGFLLCVGTYDADSLNESAKDMMLSYAKEQKALPLEKRDIPPYFEVFDTEKPLTFDDKVDEYSGMTRRTLIDLCKQRGLAVNKNVKIPELITMLVNNDRKMHEAESSYGFKTSDDFLALSSEEQVEYLDSIFCLPDGVEDGSDEESAYMGALADAVNMYSGLSLDNIVIEKVKEILEYTNGNNEG